MNGTMSYAWSLICLFRKIAFMRHANDLIHQPKRIRDFDRGRQQ